MERLQKTGMDDSLAADLADRVAGLSTDDWPVLDVLTNGQYGPDSVRVHTIGKRSNVFSLIQKLEQLELLRTLEMNIKGLPPEPHMMEIHYVIGP